MAHRRPNILDSFNSTVPVKRILRDDSKLTRCRLQTFATARGKVYQVNILVVCSPRKAKEDSQDNSDSEDVPIVGPVLVHLRVIVYQLAVHAKHKGGTRAKPDD